MERSSVRRSKVVEAHKSCTVRSEETEIIQKRSQSVELVAKPFTVLEYCCLLLHMIIHTQKVELK